MVPFIQPRDWIYFSCAAPREQSCTSTAYLKCKQQRGIMVNSSFKSQNKSVKY